jgi:hypothetical protein
MTSSGTSGAALFSVARLRRPQSRKAGFSAPHFHNRALAISAPSRIALNFSHTTVG